MKQKLLSLLAIASAVGASLLVASPAQAATAPWDYKATLTNGSSIKGWAGVTRDGITYGTGKTTVQKLPAGQYRFVLEVSAYDLGNQQTNSAVINVCTVFVPSNDAIRSCANSSLQLPYGDGLVGVAKLVGASGNVVAKGTISEDSSHFPRVFSGQIGRDFVDLYGEHLESTQKVYFQQSGTTQKFYANFQIKSNHWVHVPAPSGLAYTMRYNVVVETLHGSITLEDWFTSIPPAPVINSVMPSSLSKNGGQQVTVKGPNVGYLYTRSPFPISVDGTGISDFTIVSSSEIRFTAPAHAVGSASLMISCYGGSASSTLHYI